MNGKELCQCMEFAYGCEGPVAVRYPRGAVEAMEYTESMTTELKLGKANMLCCASASASKKVLLLAMGTIAGTALATAEELERKNVSATVVNMRFAKPFDKEMIRQLVPKHDVVVTLEDNQETGGFGQQVESFLVEEGIVPERFLNISFKDCFVEHGTPEELYKRYGLDAESVVNKVLGRLDKE